MSKINAVRFINLNYNNNSMRISDDTFQMQGRSTLMSLQNGGGKSVLVQMMTAPFVHRRYRDAKDRPFESYFTTSRPTFIMVEWKLDRGAGYCLVGMMVRKSQLTEDDAENQLEMINFICEYPGRCEQDIYHLPVVEKRNKEIVLKNYRECRQLFESYKKDHTVKFNCYDMNNSAQSKQYFDKLAEYQIYYKEWENIVRKINLEESGLSKLFADCRDEKGLIEKWFLDAVESKLNKEKDRMKEFQNIIEKYVISYKANQSKIERRNTIRQFKEDASEIAASAGEYKLVTDKVEEQENSIAGFRALLTQMEAAENAARDQLLADKAGCGQELARIEYERYSYEIVNLTDQLRFHVSNRDMIGVERDALEGEIAQIETLLHKMELAKQGEQVEDVRQDESLLKERLKVLHEGESRLEPERRALGKALGEYYEKLVKDAADQIDQNETAYQEETQKFRELEDKQQWLDENIIKVITNISTYKERMNSFNRIEDSFNEDFQETFVRNIIGEYEPGFLDIKGEQYQKELGECTRSCTAHKKLLEEANERQKSLLRDVEDKQQERIRQEYRTADLEREKADYERELSERLVMMRYFGIDLKEQWNMDKILAAADRKLTECEQMKRMLEKEEDALQKEFVRLTQGKVLELPEETSALFGRLNINIVYGMDWLKKNGYSRQRNEEIVRRQPFLPYALIMSKHDIKILSEHDREVYTSFPIPIILRERLEETVAAQESGLLELSGVSFFMWFNEKLLDEEALRLLVQEKEKQIREKKEQTAVRKKEYEEYFEKRERLKNQKLTKDAYDKNLTQLSEMEAEAEALLRAIQTLKSDVQKNEEHIGKLSEDITKEQHLLEKMRKREKHFALFCKEYETYMECMANVNRCQKEQERYEQNRKLVRDALETCRERLKSIESAHAELDRMALEYRNKYSIYETYRLTETEETAREIQLPATAQEQEARYEAITSRMSMQVQDLEKQLQKTSANRIKLQKELERLSKKYGLEESDWTGITYSGKEETHQEILLEDKRNKMKIKDRQWNDEDKETAVCQSRINTKKKDMLEKCGMEEPLAKEEITTTEFDAAINQIQFRISSIEADIKKVEQKLKGLGENLSTLAEYEDFVCRHEPQWETDITLLDAKGLRDFQGRLLRDYRNLKEERGRRKSKLTAYLYKMIQKEIYQEDYYRKPLESMISLTDSASLILAQLDTTLQSYDSQMEKLAVDISLVEKEKSRITELLSDYCQDVHNNLGQIDSNSTITIREKSVKMLKLQLPDWTEQEGMYQLKLSDFLDELTTKGVEILEKNENPQEYFGTRITTRNLYDSVVGIGNVQIKLYKVEAQREYPITWAQAAKNSGGEGFLTAFVILSSLLYYMRRDETDLFADRNEGKVLVMDNPFAQTNAAHLLKPLMDMADKMNTQLICFSGLGGDSIYGRFDNIYVLNLVASNLRGGMQYLRGEHLRGAEEETIVSSQIEVIGQQSLLF
ncbi:MAG: hypothetical protein K2G51_09315 [Lachnospiraceae bacterium]|nr:hypothetical protein [Lachnospiraceae bacterium]